MYVFCIDQTAIASRIVHTNTKPQNEGGMSSDEIGDLPETDHMRRLGRSKDEVIRQSIAVGLNRSFHLVKHTKLH